MAAQSAGGGMAEQSWSLGDPFVLCRDEDGTPTGGFERELAAAGCRVVVPPSPSAAFRVMRRNPCTMLVWGLTVVTLRHALSTLRQQRGAGVRTPVVLRLAASSVDVRCECFDAGATDVVERGVGNRELAARVRSLLTLVHRYTTWTSCGGRLRLDTNRCRVQWSEHGTSRSVRLSRQEYDFFSLLAERPGEPIGHALID